MRHGVYKLF